MSNLSNTITAADTPLFSASLWFIGPATHALVGGSGDLPNKMLLVTAHSNDVFQFRSIEIGVITSIHPVNGGKNVVAQFRDERDSGNVKTAGASTDINAYTVGVWNHLFVGVDTAQTCQVIVNGVLLADVSGDSFDIPVNANRFGVPTTTEFISGYSGIDIPQNVTLGVQMAEVQIWLGTYIDCRVASNFAKFVTISGGRGFPTNPSSAAAAFGVPTYRFTGSFPGNKTNSGNGGAVVSDGTINDYSPTPAQSPY